MDADPPLFGELPGKTLVGKLRLRPAGVCSSDSGGGYVKALFGVTSAAPGKPGSTTGRPVVESSEAGTAVAPDGAVTVGVYFGSAEPKLETDIGLVCAFGIVPFSGTVIVFKAEASGVLILVAAAFAMLVASAACPTVVAGSCLDSASGRVAGLGEAPGDIAFGDRGEGDRRRTELERGANDLTLTPAVEASREFPNGPE